MSHASTEMFASHTLATSGDVDQARDVLSEVYLPLDFPSASRSAALDLRLNVVKVGRVTAGYLRFGDAIGIRTSDASEYHIDIPLTGRAVMSAGGQAPVYATAETAEVFMPGRPAELDCDREFSQIAVMIPRAELQLELEHLLGRSITKPLEFAPELRLTSGPGWAFLESLRLIDRLATDMPESLQHPIAAQRFEQALMEMLLLSQPSNYSELLAAPAAPAGPRPIARAVELLRSDPEHAWTVSELARSVSVSVRSLQEGFRSSMGATPMGYLRDLRLERIHDELARREHGSATVTQVATRWGITHLGRFAADYRRRYSELPSDTARRPPHPR